MMLMYDSPADGSAAYDTWKELSKLRNTRMLAVAAGAAEVWFEVRVDVVLFCVPGDMPTTFTPMVQVVLAATVPPDRDTELVPAVAVTVPKQVSVTPGMLATSSPLGRVSENARPVSSTLFELPMVNVRVVVWVVNRLAEPNAFENVGGTVTSMLAVAAGAAGASFEVSVEVVLFLVPPTVPWTVTSRTQVAPAGRLLPDMVIVEGGPTAPTTEPVPPQKGANVKGPGIVSPAGRVSVNATPVSPTVFGLVMVNVRVVVPSTGTVGVWNAFENVGGAIT
jgi:hypothetical protein